MPIKVNLDGSFICDTPEEAISLQRLILKEKEPISETRGMVKRPVSALRQFHATSANQTVQAVLTKLMPYNGQTLTADKLGPLLGTESTTGVGPKLRGIRTVLEQEGGSLDDILLPQKQIDGTTVWRVRLSTTEKSE